MVLKNIKESPQELAYLLEEVMVNQFRACQTLCSLIENERKALVKRDVAELDQLLEEKESLLDEIGNNEDQRRMLTDMLAAVTGLEGRAATLADLLPMLKITAAERISHLLDGIRVVQARVRDLNTGNQALANLNIDRLSELQKYLLSLYAPTTFYQPVGVSPAVEQPARYSMDQCA